MSDGKPDKAALIAQIKKRLAEGPQDSGGGAAKDQGAEASAAEQSGGGEQDMAARIAALKAKMDAEKGKAAGATSAAASGGDAKPAAKKAAPAKKPAAGNIYPVQPINKKIFGDERLYAPNTVNLWFVAGGLLLLISVLLMWRRDYVRDWKPYQREARLLDINAFNAKIDVAGADVDAEARAEVEDALKAARAAVEAAEPRLLELQDQENELDGKFYAANQLYGIAKSELDAMRFAFEELRIVHGDDEDLLQESAAELAELQQRVEDTKAAADAANAELNAVKGEISAILADEKNAQRELDALLAEVSKLEGNLKKIESNLFNDVLRNAPVADMLSPTLKVEKVVLDKLKDNYNFMHVPKVDMCMTCHVNIGDKEYADWDPTNEKPWHKLSGGEVVVDTSRTGQRVLSAHPRLDLFVADTSPHPMGEFGCTVCHQGRGQAVEFERTFHTPTADQFETRDEKEQRWVDEYGYDPSRHYWDWPMTPTDKLYSSCFMCHSDTERIDGVPEYNESRELVEELGCYGCHKIGGLEYLRKPGPDLTNLAAKTDRSWSRKWAMSPKSFRPTTRMPHFWNLSNSGAPAETTIDPDKVWNNNSDRYVADWRERNQVEARAVIEYVYGQSEAALADGSYAMRAVPDGEGDPDAGRDTFEARGCLGCHSVEAEGWLLNDHGPDLSAVGSKVNAQWLYNWILEPAKYFDTTVMPDLRLSEQEAWDITAWLMSLRDEQWEQQPEPAGNRQILEQIAIENLSSLGGEAYARGRIADMDAEGPQTLERYVGKKLFERYGCAGCHLVPGHYEDVGIGTELTYEALKELTKFDFGHEAAHGMPGAIGHNLWSWFERKLQDPRSYDRLPIVKTDDDGEAYVAYYDQKVKLPGEKLKMPNYYLNEREVDLLVQFLLGTRDDGIDPSMKASLDADARLVEDGSRAITAYNCTGCHRAGQYSTQVEIPAGEDLDESLTNLEELVEASLEYGYWMARPFETGDVTLFDKNEWFSDEFYYPEWEETADIFEFFEEEEGRYAIPGHAWMYGVEEGAMGEYLDEKAMRPPVLRRQGFKTQPEWFYNFLLAPFTVRNHLQVRMPSFALSEHEALAIVRWFAAQDDQMWPFEPSLKTAFDQDLFDRGQELFTGTLQCLQCHPAGDQPPINEDQTTWGPDLGMAAERLKGGWIHEWLLNPQEFQPGTKMPNFFGEYSDGEYEPMYDDYEEQIEALVYYLQNLDRAGD